MFMRKSNKHRNGKTEKKKDMLLRIFIFPTVFAEIVFAEIDIIGPDRSLSMLLAKKKQMKCSFTIKYININLIEAGKSIEDIA